MNYYLQVNRWDLCFSQIEAVRAADSSSSSFCVIDMALASIGFPATFSGSDRPLRVCEKQCPSPSAQFWMTSLCIPALEPPKLSRDNLPYALLSTEALSLGSDFT